jgi:hypothetical protein
MNGLRARHLALFVAIVVSAACRAAGDPPPERTERERDSLIAGSRLPGAAGVGAAMRAQDRAAAANARIDSIAGSMDHN